MFPDEPGDDSLGYDFIVRQASGDLFFEVKATTGDLAEFELGESEVRMAQEHARNGRFRVLYVTRVLDGADRSITVLPNPFGSTSRDRFRLVGEGVRLRFTLPSAD